MTEWDTLCTEAIKAMLDLGHSEAHISATLMVPLPEVHRVNQERRRDGARMKAEWEPTMRPHTKMLEPEMRNGG